MNCFDRKLNKIKKWIKFRKGSSMKSWSEGVLYSEVAAFERHLQMVIPSRLK